MALTLHLKNMTKDGLILLSQALGTMDYNKYMTKDELSVIIVDRITVQPPATTQTHKHNTPTQTPHRLYVLKSPQHVQLRVFKFVFEKCLF